MSVSADSAGAVEQGNYVSDIFQEVDEEVRREQLKKLWDRYRLSCIVALAVLIVAGGRRLARLRVVGGQEGRRGRRRVRGGRSRSPSSGKHAEAAGRLRQDRRRTAPSGYRALARLREAAELADADPKAARGGLSTTIAADALGRPAMRDLAALRAGSLLVDTAPLCRDATAA